MAPRSLAPAPVVAARCCCLALCALLLRFLAPLVLELRALLALCSNARRKTRAILSSLDDARAIAKGAGAAAVVR